MTVPIYTPTELAQLTTEAQQLGLTRAAAIEKLESSCSDLAAILIARPESRPTHLGPLPVDLRLVTLALLDVIDEILPDHPTHQQIITERANFAIALTAAPPAAPNSDTEGTS